MSYTVRQICFDCTLSLTQNRCLAHIINLATQALISARSQSKYYNPHAEDKDEHIPDLNCLDRDELGLIRAISVKVSLCHFSYNSFVAN